MRWTGSILALFIIFHILHLTTGTVHPDFIRGNAYHNFVTGLRVPWVAAFYVIAQLCLGFHMWHGVWSLTQTLGWSHPRYEKLRRRFSYAIGGAGGRRQHHVSPGGPRRRHPLIPHRSPLRRRLPWN